LFHILDLPAAVQAPSVRPAQQLVTLTSPARDTVDAIIGIEAWFHLDIDATRTDVEVFDLSQLSNVDLNNVVAVIAETDDTLGGILVPLQIRNATRVQKNVYTINVVAERWRNGANRSRYLRVLFSPRLPVREPVLGQVPLGDYAARNDITFIGRQNNNPAGPIAAYTRLA
jgi:hypothetical protein